MFDSVAQFETTGDTLFPDSSEHFRDVPLRLQVAAPRLCVARLALSEISFKVGWRLEGEE
jgi:hypothetical protein